MIIRVVKNGAAEFHEIPDGGVPAGAQVVDRFPVAGEDFVDGQWVVNAAYVADSQVPVGHIQKAHALKTLEASMILSGYDLSHGILAQEAQLRGITLMEMAQIVRDRSNEFLSLEIGRMSTKVEG